MWPGTPRFGDTAANAGTLSLLEGMASTSGLPLGVKTMAASVMAGLFRIALMPIDTLKTIMQARDVEEVAGSRGEVVDNQQGQQRAGCFSAVIQPCRRRLVALARSRLHNSYSVLACRMHACMQVEGASGVASLRAKVAARGPTALYHGALAASAATFVGHYPWFATVRPWPPHPMCARRAGSTCSSIVPRLSMTRTGAQAHRGTQPCDPRLAWLGMGPPWPWPATRGRGGGACTCPQCWMCPSHPPPCCHGPPAVQLSQRAAAALRGRPGEEGGPLGRHRLFILRHQVRAHAGHARQWQSRPWHGEVHGACALLLLLPPLSVLPMASYDVIHAGGTMRHQRAACLALPCLPDSARGRPAGPHPTPPHPAVLCCARRLSACGRALS